MCRVLPIAARIPANTDVAPVLNAEGHKRRLSLQQRSQHPVAGDWKSNIQNTRTLSGHVGSLLCNVLHWKLCHICEDL